MSEYFNGQTGLGNAFQGIISSENNIDICYKYSKKYIKYFTLNIGSNS